MVQWAYLPLMSAGDNVVAFGVPFPNSVDSIFIQPVGAKATVPESNNTILGNSLSGFTMTSGYAGTRPYYYRAFGK
ncbi:gp53-like domain-containing protein [Yersinia mollaretii]